MISKNILVQYPYYQKELKYLSDKIDKLRNESAKLESEKKHDMVKASSREFPYIEKRVHIDGIDDLDTLAKNSMVLEEIQKLEGRYEKTLVMKNEILDFIDSIDDCQMRLITYYRIIEQYSWEKIADLIGGGNKANSIRMAFSRFLENGCE